MWAGSLGVMLAAIVIGHNAVGALAFGVSSRSYLGVAMGEAVLLIALGGARVFLGVSIGPLRRRRTFEPDRVREAPSSSPSWPPWLPGPGPLLLLASPTPRL